MDTIMLIVPIFAWPVVHVAHLSHTGPLIFVS